MKLSMPMIGGVLVGLTVAMTSGIARDGGRGITFGTFAALAQEDGGEQEAAPAMPAPEPAPYPQGAEQPAPNNPYYSGNVSDQMQYQQEQALRQEQMQQQAEQLRQQQEEIKKMINNMP